jgi:hypothetical protein
MKFERLGGASEEARGVIKSLRRAVAENIDSHLSEVAQQFWWGLSVDIEKAQHKACAKRGQGLWAYGECLDFGRGG